MALHIQRTIDIRIEKYLDTDEILLLIGARQTGKTSILKQLKTKLETQNKPCFYINLEDPDYFSLLNTSPKNLSKIIPFSTHKQTVFIDEIQYLDNPTHFLKFHYDENKTRIKLIVSGSSAFYIDQKFKDALTGRKKIFYVRPLSFQEFLVFKGEEILASKLQHINTLLEQERIERLYQEYILFGGYPKVVLTDDMDEKKELLHELVFSYTKKDIHEANIQDDLTFYKLLRILAGQIGQLVNAQELARTLCVSKTKIDHYLYVLQKTFHLYFIRPFAKNIRKELVKMPKAYFGDIGFRNFLVQNFEPYFLRNDRGTLLENMAFLQFLERYHLEDIAFWRTTQQEEVDFVIQEKEAFEVKTNLEGFKLKKYHAFLQAYPDIPFNLISFSAGSTHVNIPCCSIWQI